MKLFFLPLFFLASVPKLFAQRQIDPLNVGEKVPDINLGEIINYSSTIPNDVQALSIGQFKGKLLILDFWSSSCLACIANFPKLKKLQERFNGQLVILPVAFTVQSHGKISVVSLIERWKGTPREMKLPSTHLIQNNLESPPALRASFPFQTVPTVVWIDKEGVFRGITSADAVNERNISGILNENKTTLNTKKRLYTFNPDTTFLMPRPNGKSAKVYGSCWSECMDSLYSWGSKYLYPDTSSKGVVRFFQVNRSIYDMYATAYKNFYSQDVSWLDDKKRMAVSDSTGKLFRVKDLSFLSERDRENDSILNKTTEQFHFCYEAQLPLDKYSIKDGYKYIINDLDTKFNYKSSISKRTFSCLRLTRLNNAVKPSSFLKNNVMLQLPSPRKRDSLFDQKLVVVWAMSVNEFVDQLNSSTPDLPLIINETGYTNNAVEMIVEESFYKDYNTFLKTLRKYGLDLVPSKTTLDVLLLQKR